MMPVDKSNLTKENDQWDFVIKPRRGLFDFDLRELWRYRDLIFLFVRRDFVTFYKQTILGPLWYIIQPLLMTLVFTIVFGKIAGIPTDGVPKFIFYMAGTVAWGYFANCLNQTSNTFVTNARIFGKVYFPRLTVPASVVIINLLQFAIQLVLFICFYVYFVLSGAGIHLTWYIFLLPLVVFQMALLGFGCGVLVSSLTTKYRDLTFVMSFAVQLWMYATPVVYPISSVPRNFAWVFTLNPMTFVVETFRLAFLGVGTVTVAEVVVSWIITLLILISGVILFSRIERNFMDTV